MPILNALTFQGGSLLRRRVFFFFYILFRFYSTHSFALLFSSEPIDRFRMQCFHDCASLFEYATGETFTSWPAHLSRDWLSSTKCVWESGGVFLFFLSNLSRFRQYAAPTVPYLFIQNFVLRFLPPLCPTLETRELINVFCVCVAGSSWL